MAHALVGKSPVLLLTNVHSYSHNVPGEREFGFAQAIKVGETIYVSGQLSHDDDGNFVGANDFDAQVKQTFANLDKVLDHFGVTRNQIVRRPMSDVVDDPDTLAHCEQAPDQRVLLLRRVPSPPCGLRRASSQLDLSEKTPGR